MLYPWFGDILPLCFAYNKAMERKITNLFLISTNKENILCIVCIDSFHLMDMVQILSMHLAFFRSISLREWVWSPFLQNITNIDLARLSPFSCEPYQPPVQAAVFLKYKHINQEKNGGKQRKPPNAMIDDTICLNGQKRNMPPIEWR